MEDPKGELLRKMKSEMDIVDEVKATTWEPVPVLLPWDSVSVMVPGRKRSRNKKRYDLDVTGGVEREDMHD
jgi:hypothetical protein